MTDWVSDLRDLADWWDGQKDEAYTLLREFSYENQNNLILFYGPRVLALPWMASAEFGSGFIDLLRLGEGIEEGGAGGYAQDGLRLLMFLGGMPRLLKITNLKLFTDPFRSFGVCSWVSATQALRHTGTRFFATVEDLARVSNLHLPKSIPPHPLEIGGAFVSQMTRVLKQLGARVDPVHVQSLSEIKALAAKNFRDVVMFSVQWNKMNANGTMSRVGHTMYMFKSALGVRIVDRSGRAVKSLDDLEDLYGGISTATLYAQEPVHVIRGATVLKVSENAAQIAFGMGLFYRGSEEELEQSYIAFKDDQAGPVRAEKPSPKQPKTVMKHHHVVKKGESLSRISKLYYGKSKYWKTIYRKNRNIIGSDPNVIHPGQRLYIPMKPGK